MRTVSQATRSTPRWLWTRAWSSSVATCRRSSRLCRTGEPHQNLPEVLVHRRGWNLLCGSRVTSSVVMTTQALHLPVRCCSLVLADLSSRLPQVSDALNLIRELLQQLTNQRASIEEDVHSNFEDLHKQLDVRKSVLLMELEVTYGLKQKVQLQDILSSLTGWSSRHHVCTSSRSSRPR